MEETSIRRCVAVVITTAQLHSPQSELRFCAGSNPACSPLKVCHGENLRQLCRLEIMLNACCWSIIPEI